MALIKKLYCRSRTCENWFLPNDTEQLYCSLRCKKNAAQQRHRRRLSDAKRAELKNIINKLEMLLSMVRGELEGVDNEGGTLHP